MQKIFFAKKWLNSVLKMRYITKIIIKYYNRLISTFFVDALMAQRHDHDDSQLSS